MVVHDGLADLQEVHPALGAAPLVGEVVGRDPPRVGRRQRPVGQRPAVGAREGVVDLEDAAVGVGDDERLLDGAEDRP